MTIKQFGADYRLTVTRDECGDAVILGKRGHLYVDGGRLCAMWLDSPPVQPSRLATLGAKVWQGDVSLNRAGRRVQDAWVKNISPDKYREAIRLVGAKRRRTLSQAEVEVRRNGYAASPLFNVRSQRPKIRLGSIANTLGAPNHEEA